MIGVRGFGAPSFRRDATENSPTLHFAGQEGQLSSYTVLYEFSVGGSGVFFSCESTAASRTSAADSGCRPEPPPLPQLQLPDMEELPVVGLNATHLGASGLAGPLGSERDRRLSTRTHRIPAAEKAG